MNKKRSTRPLWVALALSAAMLAIGAACLDNVTAAAILHRLLLPLGRLLVVITVGLAVGQVIEATGWTDKLGLLGAPLFRFARLGPHGSAAFSAAFVSGAAANAMLYEFWKEEKISRYQLMMTSLANQLPAYFLHLPTTVFIVLPLTGIAGALYFLLTFIAAVLRLLVVLLWGHWRPAVSGQVDGSIERPPAQANRWAVVAVIRQRLPGRLTSVATYVVPIYIAVFLLSSAGVFEWTQQKLTHWTAVRFVPVEALSLVVLSFAAEFTSGFAAAGALLREGVVTTQQAVLALLIGNIVAFPIRALRHQIPRLMGIFTPKMGLQLLLLGQGSRVASLIVVGAAYYLMF
ncbi:MAG: nucleoside recognition protein [Thermodesulfobacteriota bacterium]|nr:nucleoside recognition protein [Thermodesulfobacteriota bacterium]